MASVDIPQANAANEIVQNVARSVGQDMIAWRRDIHKHPELAFKEERTADVVAQVLRECGLTTETGIAKTGVVATLKSGTSDRAIALRADMDALQLEELNEFEHRSVNEGRMHACGHDGHTAMLLGAAKYLTMETGFDGRVIFIFQPAEEGEAGAQAMIDEGLFHRYDCEAVFGMHNWPGLEAGVFAVQPGPVMAAFDSFDIRIIGRGGHAAFPHEAIDPIVVAAQLIQALQSIVSRGDPLQSAVLSVTRINAGHTYNVIPEEAHLSGTVRTLDPGVQDHIEESVRRIANHVCAAAGARAEVRYERSFPQTINSTTEAEVCADVVANTFGAAALRTDYPPSMGSEDFAYMLKVKPGCYVKLGNGIDTAGNCLLHNPRYDFNDSILATGAAYWVALVRSYLTR